uniref:Calumenin n=1 Tax=Aceria tosichella TaxID=561515 RepID=A0A6G1SAQ9_9ACAR
MHLSNSCHCSYAICTILLAITWSNTIVVHAKRGNLLQENEKDTGTDQESGQKVANQNQLADPEYIKRELKDVVSRLVDTDNDGQVSYEELKKYLAVLHEKNIEHNVNKQWTVYSPQIHEVFSWEGYEPEKKEVLTWDHYYNQTYPELVGVDVGVPLHREQDTSGILEPAHGDENKLEDNKPKLPEVSTDDDNSDDDPHMKMLKLMVRRADARWKLADENGDTLLTKDEFKNLLHPDEGHDGLKELFVREATEDMDLNKDGKICLDEFMKHLQVLANDQEKTDQSWLTSQQENFGRFLDKNKDGVLEKDEIRNWLVPSKSVKFETEAKRLLDIGDTNDDHKISVAELIEHYEQYLSLLPADYWSNLSDVENNHDDSSPANMVMGDAGAREEL